MVEVVPLVLQGSGGNVGIGITPSAWSGRTVLQVYNGGVNWGSASGTGGSTGFL